MTGGQLACLAFVELVLAVVEAYYWLLLALTKDCRLQETSVTECVATEVGVVTDQQAELVCPRFDR